MKKGLLLIVAFAVAGLATPAAALTIRHWVQCTPAPVKCWFGRPLKGQPLICRVCYSSVLKARNGGGDNAAVNQALRDCALEHLDALCNEN